MSDKKIISIEERIPQLKQSRKKKANRRLVFYLSIFFLLIGIIVYLQSPLSGIKTIGVTGNTSLEKDFIISQSGIQLGDNLWKVEQKDVKEALLKIPEIKNVSVKRNFPSSLIITITEFHRVGYVKIDGSYFPILENGTELINQPMNLPNGDAPILLGFEEGIYLSEFTEELTNLPLSISNLISEIHWIPTDENPYRVKLYMNNGLEVHTSIRRFSQKMLAYPSIAQQIDPNKPGVLHIDVGAFFKPLNENDEEVDNDEIEG
ncbi:FtsQ-type POTRA domain-containing protein [Bacillaceae bacterium S4-13-58]